MLIFAKQQGNSTDKMHMTVTRKPRDRTMRNWAYCSPNLAPALGITKIPRHLHALAIILVTAMLLGGLTGCSWNKVKRNYDQAADFVFDVGPTTAPLQEEDETPIIDLNYEAADELASDLGNDIDRLSTILVHPFVNLGQKTDPSPFGRVVAEQLAARLAQRDFAVLMAGAAGTRQPIIAAPEANATAENEVFAKLTKSSFPAAQTEMTGSYLIGGDVIYLSTSISDLTTGAVYSGWQWTLPINKNTMTLLPQLKSPAGGVTPSVQRQF